jgi:hypothetical protein
VVLCLVVVVVVGYRCMVVLMRGWAVMMLRMIVPEILVHMEGRPRGRRDDQGLNKRACDEARHRVQSTMTAAGDGRIAVWRPEARSVDEGGSLSPQPREKVAKFIDDAIGRPSVTRSGLDVKWLACPQLARQPSTSGWSPARTDRARLVSSRSSAR